MTEKLPYSGRTSTYEHKHGNAWEKTPFAGNPAVTTMRVINAQWSNMPVEVENDVKSLWRYCEFGNDNYYWEGSIDELDEIMEPYEEGDNIGIEVEVWVDSQDNNTDDCGWKKQHTTLPYLRQWLAEQGFTQEEKFLLHWWW